MGLAPYGKKDEALYSKLRPLFRVEGLNLLGDNNAVYDTMMAARLPRGEPALAAADRSSRVEPAAAPGPLLASRRDHEPSDDLPVADGPSPRR